MKRIIGTISYVALLNFGFITTAISAQTYPSDPIKFIVPFNAGGGTDVVARMVSEFMTTDLGQPVVVENRSGANGIVGTKAGAVAKPNGYTVTFVLQATMALNPGLYKATNYHPLEDFEPISQLADVPYVVLAHPSLGVKNIQELVEKVKANPNTIDFASGAAASYLASLMLQNAVGIEMTHIPYSGSAQALSDVIGGRVKVMLSSPVSVLSHIQSGKLVPLAVTSPQRIESLPDVPTVAEQGYPGFNISGWYGMAAPKGTSKEVIDKLNKSVQAALANDTVRANFAKAGVSPQGSSPEQFNQLIKSEHQRWSSLIKEAGIEAQ